MPRLSADGDRGAVSSIVVMLMATGVLLGMTAMVVDVGQLYAEREELQSGADSAAMTVALDCVKRRSACTTQALAKAENVADANAGDGRANIEELCGRDNRWTVPTCLPDGTVNLADCIGNVRAGVNYVQVRTRTEVATDEFVLPFAFAQSMAGIGEGATVGACSRVAYGPPRLELGLTISACEYERTRGNTVAGPPWPPDPPAHREVQLGDHDHTAHFCGAAPPPAGWGWPNDVGMFDNTDGRCFTQVEADLTYDGNDTHLPSLECRNRLAQLRSSRQVIALPVIDGERGSGSSTRYHLYRLAAFVVTGYSMHGFHAPSTVSSGFGDCDPLDPHEVCIFGYFIDLDFLPGEVGPDPGIDLGLLAIKTIG
ncbi:hypothetical protein Rhe02_69920 [Rhizocola hellebori]|uniref:Putative Flp pilus-assembly TadG-like N-terminal domain-containing protein n=1 Tax=Rhizocola hellebori TaxID=1392758 RepID=A0A8J3QDT0_9ACTN|nr:Tad domain-containing protein [Rhizocola hellebori]GIH08925.1 hypothetical protein Rhe02_69920 [Rhizocola hellebori]